MGYAAAALRFPATRVRLLQILYSSYYIYTGPSFFDDRSFLVMFLATNCTAARLN